MAEDSNFLKISLGLDRSGLIWYPEIGDEVAERTNLDRVSIFVDPQGLTPRELRTYFLWMPTVEQLVSQFEARQALIYHAGINQSLVYEAVVKTAAGVIEASGQTLRIAFGSALSQLLNKASSESVH